MQSKLKGYYLYKSKFLDQSPVKLKLNDVEILRDGDVYLLAPYESTSIQKIEDAGGIFHWFTWNDLTKIITTLKQKKWVFNLHAEDDSLVERIFELRNSTTISFHEVLEQIGNEILTTYSRWPDVNPEPSFFVTISFTAPFSEDLIEVRYGEVIFIDSIFFSEKRNELNTFFSALKQVLDLNEEK